MNPLIHLEKITLALLMTVVLVCFGVLPQLQAVSPTPDGCYPNFTTAEGCYALNALTTGAGNTAIGWRSLFLNTDGSFNTGVGGGALALNNGISNTAVGAAALLFNTTGTENTAIGTAALEFNGGGGFNSAVGAFALYNNTEGTVNTAVGRNALFTNSTGSSNTAVGVTALVSNVSGTENTAIGPGALGSNIDGSHNVAVGQASLTNNTHGSDNIAVGEFAGQSVTASNNVICIGTQGLDVSNSCFIGNIFNATITGGSAVFIDANNKLGTMTSSKRFKEDIQPMDKASNALFSLKPVTFRYKKGIDPAGTPQLGLVAEDVERVNPNLVVRDKEGKPYSVRYDQVNAMLLNEFLKEHKTVQEQGATIARLEQQIEALTEGLQKVSAQLEASKPAPRTVLNSQ